MAGLNEIAKVSGVKYEDALKVINGIKDTIKKGERVTIQDLGTFSLDVQDERESRNPSIPGETFIVPAKMIPKFKFSQSFKNTVSEEVAIDQEMLANKRAFRDRYHEKANDKVKKTTKAKK